MSCEELIRHASHIMDIVIITNMIISQEYKQVYMFMCIYVGGIIKRVVLGVT